MFKTNFEDVQEISSRKVLVFDIEKLDEILDVRITFDEYFDEHTNSMIRDPVEIEIDGESLTYDSLENEDEKEAIKKMFVKYGIG